MRNASCFALQILLLAMLSSNPALLGQDDLDSWQFTSSLIIPRFEAAAVVAGDYLYVIGGHGQWATDPYGTIERALIREDGTLGKWILEADTLPIPVYGPGAIAKSGFIYVIAGNPHPYQPTTIVQYAPINPDGSLGPWQQTSSLNQQRVNIGVAEYNGHIYAMGGNAVKAINSVEYATINPDGTLSGWTYTSSNLTDRWLPSAIAYNGYLYLLGGFIYNSVEMAHINPDGSLAEWQYTSTMNQSRSGTPGIAIIEGYMYVLAGDAGSPNFHNTIERALINPNGTLGSWIIQPDTLLCRVDLTACVQVDQHVYMIGGQSVDGNPTDDIEMNYQMAVAAICGDANCDASVNISDAVWIINYVFIGGNDPCDSDGDGIQNCYR